MRRVDAARGSIETDRLRRLRKLANLLVLCKSLPLPDQERAAKAFQDLVTHSKTPLPNPSVTFKEPDYVTVKPVTHMVGDESWGDLHEDDIAEALSLTSDANSLPPLFAELTIEDGFVQSADFDPEIRLPADEETNTDPTVPQSMDPDELPSALATLYHDYQNSIPQLATLPELASAEPEDTPVLYAMSKLQHELAIDEGQVWVGIHGMIATDAEDDKYTSVLQALEERSAYMSQSYERRNNPPTAETYAECRLILEAMGVPCIEATGPYEAEAVASSIVVNGYGDYVVSEDSVSHFVIICAA